MTGFKKDLFGLKDMTAEEIEETLATAQTMKYVLTQPSKTAPHLQGKTVIILFYDSSARAKLSFELAAGHLSAKVIDMTHVLQSHEMSDLQDMGQLVDQMGADFIILLHPMAGSAHLLAKNVQASVINAGDGFNENPGQALLDLMSIQEQKGKIEGLNVTIIGDILHSRVAKSNIWGLSKLGANIRVTGPSTVLPYGLEEMGVQVYYDAKKAIQDADVILTTRVHDIHDNHQHKYFIPSMEEYKHFFRVDEKLLSYAKEDAIVMHPGRSRRGIEISSNVFNSKQCIINDQMANSVAVRMAMLYRLNHVGGNEW